MSHTEINKHYLDFPKDVVSKIAIIITPMSHKFRNCLKVCFTHTLSGQKYLYTAKYPSTDCAIYRLKDQLGTKMGIEICRDQKFIVIALTLVEIFDFSTFHEVLIY